MMYKEQSAFDILFLSVVMGLLTSISIAASALQLHYLGILQNVPNYLHVIIFSFVFFLSFVTSFVFKFRIHIPIEKKLLLIVGIFFSIIIIYVIL